MTICLNNCYAQCCLLETVWLCIFNYLMTGLCALNCSSSSILSNGKYMDQIGKVNWKIHKESNITSLFNWQLFKAEHIPNIHFKTPNSQGYQQLLEWYNNYFLTYLFMSAYSIQCKPSSIATYKSLTEVACLYVTHTSMSKNQIATSSSARHPPARLRMSDYVDLC